MEWKRMVMGAALLGMLAMNGVAAEEDEDDRRFNHVIFEFSGNQLNPRTPNRLNPSVGGGLMLALRPWRYLQLDLANADSYSGTSGDVRITRVTDGANVYNRLVRNHAVVFNSGASLVLPLFKERLLLTGGGGYAGMKVDETIDNSNNEQVVQFLQVTLGRRILWQGSGALLPLGGTPHWVWSSGTLGAVEFEQPVLHGRSCRRDEGAAVSIGWHAKHPLHQVG